MFPVEILKKEHSEALRLIPKKLKKWMEKIMHNLFKYKNAYYE
jgi:hypothetical protein